MMATQYRVDPRVRAYGKARIDITLRAKDEQDWQSKWKDPRYPFPFTFGNSWKHCVEYRVDDFAAEVGFFMDVLGFPAQTFSPSYAIFTSPGQDFSISVVAASDGYFSTPPDAIRLQFMVEDILETAEELERRGVKFELYPERNQTGGLVTGFFRTPHGICVDLLGYERPARKVTVPPQPVVSKPSQEVPEPEVNQIEDMPLFTSPIEPDDPLFQFPKDREKPDEDLDIAKDIHPLPENLPGNPKPSSLTNAPRTPRLPTRDSDRRMERNGRHSRPDPFRSNGSGLNPIGARRSRYSTGHQTSHLKSEPALTEPEQPEAKEKTRKKGNGSAAGHIGKRGVSNSRKEVESEGRPPSYQESEPEELVQADPEEELHYEDINESEDYDLPY